MKLCMLFLEAEAPCSRRGLAPDGNAEALRGFCSKPGHITAMWSPDKGAGLGGTKISLNMYVEKETRHLCSYVILNLDETQRDMRCLTRAGQRRRPGRMRMPHMKQGPAGHGRAPALHCLPLLSLHTVSRKSPQLIEFFTETESSDGRFMKFLSGEVSQPQAGPAGRGDRAAQGAARQGPERPSTAGVKTPHRNHNPSSFSWGTRFLPSLKSLT